MGMWVRAAETSGWTDEMACEIVAQATKGWQEFDANAAAASELPSIHLLTTIGLLESRFEVSAVGKVSGVTAKLLLIATGSDYPSGMSLRIDQELAARGVVDEWKIDRRLSGWRLTVTGEIVKASFESNPTGRLDELLRRDGEVLDEKMWSSVQVVSVEGLEPAAETPVPERLTPHWDSATGELTFDGEVIRNVAVRAYCIRLVLDAFQEKGWPRNITDPATHKVDCRDIPTTCRSLREGLRRIDVRPDGTGKGYRWIDLGDQ